LRPIISLTRRRLQEVARVLESGGTSAFEDKVAPDSDTLDEFLNKIETIRDPTYVRSHRAGDWFSWLTNARLIIDDSRVVTKTLDFDEWVETSTRQLSGGSDYERRSTTAHLMHPKLWKS
jgi:hypothetical protein